MAAIKSDRASALLAVVMCAAAVSTCAVADHHRHLLEDSKPPNAKYPCSASSKPGAVNYLTVVSKCKKDAFTIAYVYFGADMTPRRNRTYATYLGDVPDYTTFKGATTHEWLGLLLDLDNPADPGSAHAYTHLAVQRLSDGKIVVPKGVKPDGSFYDITATKRIACLFFQQGSKPATLVPHAVQLTADGSKVTGAPAPGSSAQTGLRYQLLPFAVPCEQYIVKAVNDTKAGHTPGTYGKLVDTYAISGCLFGVDDCSS